MYARYVNHLTSESCYVYSDCNSLNETTEDVHEWVQMDILWNGLFSWVQLLIKMRSSAGFNWKRNKQPPQCHPRLQWTEANKHMPLRYGTHRMHKAGGSITKYGERPEMRALGRKAEGESVNTEPATATDKQKHEWDWIPVASWVSGKNK